MSAFFCKKLEFFGKNSTFTQSNNMRAVLEILTANENVSYTDYASRIWLLDCSKLAMNWKSCNDVKVFWHGSS